MDLNNLLSTARCTGYLITNVYVVEQIICIQTKILCHVNHANQIYSGWADKLVSKQTYQMIKILLGLKFSIDLLTNIPMNEI